VGVGWNLVASAGGVFVDAWASWTLTVAGPSPLRSVVMPAGPDQGSIGLLPAYLGMAVGLVGLVVLVHRWAGAALAAVFLVGVAATFVFWFSYPERATAGGLGSLVIGCGVLALPGWGRVASP
jgi:hypothetical protein